MNVFIKSFNLISDGQTKGIEVIFNDLSLFLSEMLEMDCIIEHFLINNHFKDISSQPLHDQGYPLLEKNWSHLLWKNKAHLHFQAHCYTMSTDMHFDLWWRNFISKEALFEPNFCDKSLLHLVRSTTQLRCCWEVNQMSHEDRLLCHLLLQNATKRGQNGLLTRNSINSTTRVLNDRNSCPDSTLF